MTLSPAKKLAIVAAVQILILSSVIGFKQYTVATGETVLLKVEPYDPRDPFRGDYVQVRYEISTLDDGLLVDGYIDGKAFVELTEGDDGYWHAVAIHDDRKREFAGSRIIKGAPQYSGRFDDYGTIRLDYGIEEIFIPEGSGDQIPFGSDSTIAVAVKIDRFGNAVARYFTVDGKRLDLKRD